MLVTPLHKKCNKSLKENYRPENGKRSIDKGKVFGALLTDLSKAFDCLNHDLLRAKLNAYGFSFPALRLIHDYLLNRKQRIRINNSYSTWVEIVFWGTSRINTWSPFGQHFPCTFFLHCK